MPLRGFSRKTCFLTLFWPFFDIFWHFFAFFHFFHFFGPPNYEIQFSRPPPKTVLGLPGPRFGFSGPFWTPNPFGDPRKRRYNQRAFRQKSEKRTRTRLDPGPRTLFVDPRNMRYNLAGFLQNPHVTIDVRYVGVGASRNLRLVFFDLEQIEKQKETN